MDQSTISALAKALAPLVAREILEILRAESAQLLPTPLAHVPQVLEVGNLVVDELRQEVTLNGEPITLKPREFALLAVMARNPGQAFSREHLLDAAWPMAEELDNNRTVDVHVARLRVKLGDTAAYIKTVHGYGYKVDAKS